VQEVTGNGSGLAFHHCGVELVQGFKQNGMLIIKRFNPN
jgi:hypothetical protein